ncbi:hypothetical protein OAD45_05520, partial [Gammaproteobacteria bacterium]|nr:hypothetical protein [Gammaproteobacteria bacterium]
MQDLKWSEIIKRNKQLSLKMKGPVKKVALLSNSSNFQLKEILELKLRELGISIEIDLGDYDLILQDSAHFKNHDAVIIFWELSNLIDGLYYKYNSLSDEKLDSLIDKVESEIKLTLSNLKETPLVLINEFSSMIFDANVLEQSKLSLSSNRLNDFIKNTTLQNQLVVNVEKIIA